MSSCPSTDELFDLVAEGGDTAASAALHQHLRSCEACRGMLADFGRELEPAPPDESESDQPAAALCTGTVIGRYEVVKLLGLGAMGEVWEALDPSLGRSVALKVLRGRAASGDPLQQQARVWREAQAMARLSHPNVVAVHEVVSHGGQLFLAMDLVVGGTLRAWLASKPRKLDEVLSAFVEAARGLAAAHAAGLVHRDFKPDNLLIGDDGRVRVTDFGLARSSEVAELRASSPGADPSEARLTQTGALLGTPAYMAPEQMRGEPIDARADLFSFCASLFEAVQSEPPFKAGSLAELRCRAEANEVTPRAPTVPAWLRKVLLKGLRADRTERWASMDELIAAIQAGRARAHLRLRWRRTAASLLLLALAVSVIGLIARPAAAPAMAVRRSVAVLGPRNANGMPGAAWLSSALADMLGAELAAGEQLRLVPGRGAAEAAANLGLRGAPELRPGDLRRLRETLGSDLVVAGSYLAPAAGPLRLELRLYEAVSGRAIAVITEVAESSQLAPLATRAGDKLRQALQLAKPAVSDASSSFPSDPEAERLLAEGRAQLAALAPHAALATLVRASRLAPDNVRVLMALAEVHAELGDNSAARADGKRAFASAAGLGREERLRIERLMVLPAAGDWRRAVEISQSLWTFFPDDAEYGLRLASDLLVAQRIDDAKGVLAQIRKLPPPPGRDPRIDLIESNAGSLAGDHELARDAAARCAEGAQKRSSRLLFATCRARGAEALRRLGQPAAAIAALAEAGAIYLQLGDRRGAAAATLALGRLSADTGDLAKAGTRFEDAVRLARELDDLYLEAAATNDLGNLQRRLRHNDEALATFARAGKLADRLNRPIAVLAATVNRANVLAVLGRLQEASAEYEAAEALDARTPGRPAHFETAAGRFEIALQRGELTRARALAEEALAAAGSDSINSGQAQLCLAIVDLADGRLASATEHASRSTALLKAARDRDDLAVACAILSRAHLDGGKVAEAALAAAAARDALAGNQSSRASALVGIAGARAQARQPGQLAPAIGALRVIAAEAEKTGSMSDRLEANLALGELLLRAGDREGRVALNAVVSDAGARGFKLIADAAARAQAAP